MNSSANRWELAKEIFHRALETPASNRTRFLEEACGCDLELQHAVARLLEFDAESERFLETSAAEEAASVITREYDLALQGRSIGPYRLIREIGSGGMGSVYLAERADEHYQKLCAIKLVRPGFDRQLVIERFRHERQILASLDHPNIAKLLDGGASE